MSRYAAAHVKPEGPGDSRPTALDIVRDEELVGKLVGRVVLITGASSGIGVETARALHETGADIYVTARDQTKAQSAIDDILKSSSGKGKLEILHLELGSLQSVREFAADFPRHSKQLNVLINNAGVMACPEGITQDGFETQFGTNHLAHFLLFELLKPLLLQSSTPEFQSRVVSLSSRAHQRSTVQLDDLDFKKRGYDNFQSYGQSKTANIWFANELERRYGFQGVHATSVHPGGIATDLQRHIGGQSRNTSPEFQAYRKNAEQGAATTVWAAVGKEWEGKGGKYLENVSISEPAEEGKLAGYSPYIYDDQGAVQLWDLSVKLTEV